VPALVPVLTGWFELVALTVCIGTITCRLLILPGGAEDGQRGVPSAGMLRLFGGALALLFAASIAGLFVRTAEMSGRPAAETLSLVGTVLFRTHFGRVWLARCAALSLLAFLHAAGGRRRDTTPRLLLLLGLVLLVSLTLSATGHAADAGDFSLREIVDWLHLLAASVWGGGILVLSLVLVPEAVQSQDRGGIVALSRGFSRVASVATVVLVATAAFAAASAVGWSASAWRTSYGLKIVAKGFLLFFLLDLGEWKGIRADEDPRPYLRDLRSGALLVAGALLLAAALKHDIPARHADHASGGGHMPAHGGHR